MNIQTNKVPQDIADTPRPIMDVIITTDLR